MCTAFITNTASFYAMRGLLGITEVRLRPLALLLNTSGGHLPGRLVHGAQTWVSVAADRNELTRYYKRSEITVRVGFFMCVAGLAIAR